MMVALQATAVRSLVHATEGMAAWVAWAWVRLGTSLLLLLAMAVVAPLAACAATLAWASRAVLWQVRGAIVLTCTSAYGSR